mgnify:CR=1 FL=1
MPRTRSRMADNLARKLIGSHLVDGDPVTGSEIGLRVDQAFTQDATGPLVMRELEAIGLERIHTDPAVQYIDHHLFRRDGRDAAVHQYLEHASARFGAWFSPAGNGVSHVLHLERLAIPGGMLLGADSHAAAVGALGMLAIGAGGLEVGLAMAGEPYYMTMPRVFGVRLSGALPDWCSARDVALELLRRHGVEGGLGRILEFRGPGLEHLSVMDRHAIAAMSGEMGVAACLFPADEAAREFLRAQGREADFAGWQADDGAPYDESDELDLSTLVPLIACPSSPGNVVPVSEVAGRPVGQVCLGSGASAGLRELAVPAGVLAGHEAAPGVSLEINPATPLQLENLAAGGYLGPLLHAGARLHEPGCHDPADAGQAPPAGCNSLRTVSRNDPGRSGTPDDAVYLCSAETAAASALAGTITDPRTLGRAHPHSTWPDRPAVGPVRLARPGPEAGEARRPQASYLDLPALEPLPHTLAGPVLLKLGDDISTAEIMPAPAWLPGRRGDIEAGADRLFAPLEPGFAARARALGGTPFFVVAGEDYGRGSSDEHAALVARTLGLRCVIAASFARIHRRNLLDFGILPLTFIDPGDRDRIGCGTRIELRGVAEALAKRDNIIVARIGGSEPVELMHGLSARQCDILLAGGLINRLRSRR